MDFLKKFSNTVDVLISIIESSYDGIYITDGNANTIFINQSYSAISGLSTHDVIGKNMRDLVDSGLISCSGTLMALKKRASVTLEQEFKTGKQALVTSTPIFDEDHNIIIVVTNVREQTELNRLRGELEESSETARRYRREIELMWRQYQDGNELVAVDRKMLDVIKVIERVAQLDTPVLFLGETGTGKDCAAAYLYSKSTRGKQNFIKVNCGAIPDNLIESELFGYVGGAFTGASSGGKIGFFGAADKGTIFLDEIGELSLNAQVKLLRVLQEQEIIQVGASASKKIDVRVLAATNRNLGELVHQGKFRADLYYRLNVFPIRVPPLRDRKNDIAVLGMHMLQSLNRKYGESKIFSQTAIASMVDYGWPGNVRELKNIVERAFIMSGEETISAADLNLWPLQPLSHEDSADGTLDLKGKLERTEYGYIVRAYALHGNVRAAAKSLGMDSATFTRKRKRYAELYGRVSCKSQCDFTICRYRGQNCEYAPSGKGA
jgi:PAS domain S-box-containing protein